MNSVVPTELGTEKISKLLKQYAVPGIIAMTASSLYNMCDSIFIGQGVGPYAIAGLAITFPLMNLSTAIGTLTGVGASTLISLLLGQKNYDKANKVLGNSLMINIICGGIFALFALSFLTPILSAFGASEVTMPYAREYMRIILFGNVVTHVYFGMNNMVRAVGLPRKAMGATLFTVIINAIMDPIFIFVFKWGIRGAAIATVISQLLATCYVLKIMSNKGRVVNLCNGFKRGIFKIKKKIVTQTFSIGLSPCLMNSCSCVILIVLNNQLKFFGGDLAVAAYGIVNRLGYINGMIVMGFNQGMQPIAGYNYGARNYDRVAKVLKQTIIYATCVTCTFFLVAEIFPKQVSSIFTNDPELMAQAIKGLRIYFCALPIVGFQMVTANFFQSIGLAKKAIFLSLSRQVICLLPLLLILPPIFKIAGVWWSMPCADLFASIVTAFMLYWQYKTFKRETPVVDGITVSENK